MSSLAHIINGSFLRPLASPVVLRASFVAVFFVTHAFSQDRAITLDSLTIPLFTQSLAAQFEYRHARSYAGNVEARHPDVVLLDSNIAPDHLPRLPLGVFIIKSARQIEDSATHAGPVLFMRLARLEMVNRDSVVASWEKEECYFSHKWSKIVYRVHERSTVGYRQTSEGWKPGMGQRENIDYIEEE